MKKSGKLSRFSFFKLEKIVKPRYITQILIGLNID